MTILIPALMAAACSTQVETPVTRPDYDSEVNCLNGTMIVSSGDEYGLADTSGVEILPATYDDIYFISDDVAAAFTGDICCYFDKTGRRLGEAAVPKDVTPEEVWSMYQEMEKGRRELWDSVLDKYSELRRYCSSDSATAGTAALIADDIRAALREIDGPMEKDQKARFESERSEGIR